MEEELIGQEYPDYYEAVKPFIDRLPDPRPKETLSKMKAERWTPRLAWARLYDELIAISAPVNLGDKQIYDSLAEETDLKSVIRGDPKIERIRQSYPILFESLQVIAPITYALDLISRGKTRDAIDLVGYDSELTKWLNSDQLTAFYATKMGLNRQDMLPAAFYTLIIEEAIRQNDLAAVRSLLPKINSLPEELIIEAIRTAPLIAEYIIRTPSLRNPDDALKAAVEAQDAKLITLILTYYRLPEKAAMEKIVDRAVKDNNPQVIDALIDQIEVAIKNNPYYSNRYNDFLKLLLDDKQEMIENQIETLIRDDNDRALNNLIQKNLRLNSGGVTHFASMAIKYGAIKVLNLFVHEFPIALSVKEFDILLDDAVRYDNANALRLLLNAMKFRLDELTFLHHLLDRNVSVSIWQELERHDEVMNLLRVLSDPERYEETAARINDERVMLDEIARQEALYGGEDVDNPLDDFVDYDLPINEFDDNDYDFFDEKEDLEDA